MTAVGRPFPYSCSYPSPTSVKDLLSMSIDGGTAGALSSRPPPVVENENKVVAIQKQDFSVSLCCKAIRHTKLSSSQMSFIN